MTRAVARAVAMAIAILLANGTAGAADPKTAGKAPATAAAKPAGKKSNWAPPGCPPPPAEKEKSSVKITGPCETDWTVDAQCENEIDDLTFIATRKVRDGAEMILYVNVERYKGAGNYKPPNDLYVSVQKGSTIYRWSGNDFEATIGPGSKFVTLKNARAEPELPLVGCTGPQINYQCDGRGDDTNHMESLATVTGTLYCKAGGIKK